MKTRKHIKKLENLFGRARDEINKMVAEGHVRNAALSLEKWDNACHDILCEAERCNFIKGENNDSK